MMFWLAEGAAPAQGGDYGWVTSIIPIAAIFLIFWFLIFRPERQKQKKRKEMLATLSKNDKVVTMSGIFGIVKRSEEHTSELQSP